MRPYASKLGRSYHRAASYAIELPQRELVPITMTDAGPAIRAALISGATFQLPSGITIVQSKIDLTGLSAGSVVGNAQATLIYGKPIPSASVWPIHPSDPAYQMIPIASRDDVRIIPAQLLGIAMGTFRTADTHFESDGQSNGSLQLPLRLTSGSTPMRMAASAKGHDRHLITAVNAQAPLAILTTDNTFTAPGQYKNTLAEVWATEFKARIVGCTANAGVPTMMAMPSTMTYGQPVDLAQVPRFRLLNNLAYLTEPGEYVIDYSAGLIYLIPVDPGDTIYVHDSPYDLFNLTNCSGLSFSGFGVVGARRNHFTVKSSSGVQITNVISVGPGRCSVESIDSSMLQLSQLRSEDAGCCAVYAVDRTGVFGTGQPYPMPMSNTAKALTGSLTISSGVFVRSGTWDCSVASVYIESGIAGASVTNCKFYDLPSMAIRMQASASTITGCIVDGACKVQADSGAIYQGQSAIQRGGNWSSNAVRGVRKPLPSMNPTAAFMNDDGNCGKLTINQNYVENCDALVHANGGRWITLDRNVAKDCSVYQIMGTSLGLGLLLQARILNFADQCVALTSNWTRSAWVTAIGETQVSEIEAMSTARAANLSNTTAAVRASGWVYTSGQYDGYLTNAGCSVSYKAGDFQGTTPTQSAWNYGWTINSNSANNASVTAPSWTMPARAFNLAVAWPD